MSIAFTPELATANGHGPKSVVQRLKASKPRIVHICTRFARGGSEQRLEDIVAALPEYDHWVIVGQESDVKRARQRLARAQVVVEPSLRRSVDPRRDLLALAGLRRRIRELGGEVIVTHQSKAGVLGRLAARATGKTPVIHSLSMADFGEGYGAIEGRIFRFLERRLARWTAAYAVVGSDLARRFNQIGVPRDRLNVIRSGVRLPHLHASRRSIRKQVAAKYDLPTDRPWVLHVGSLDQRKNVLDLPIMLQQILQLSAAKRPFLIVAGAGPQEDDLRGLISKIGVQDDCRMLGYVEDPADLFIAADAVVLLSQAEGLPQVLVQAAAVGTPFVSTAVDGADELLELGAAGSVVELGEVVGAARALLPYLRWPIKRSGRMIDLSSWDPNQVREDYRALIASVSDSLAGKLARGRVVALIGADGTNTADVCNALAARFRDIEDVVQLCLGAGEEPGWLRQLRRLPSQNGKPGAAVRPDASNPNGSRRSDGTSARGLGLLDAIETARTVMIAQEKRARLTRAFNAVNEGALVLTDRFPQAQVTGTCEGPQLPTWASNGHGWRKKLADWERQPYDRADELQPDLVIRLRVSQYTAVLRCPHIPPEELLARKRVIETLQFNGADCGVVDIDADRPIEAVVDEAFDAIVKCLMQPLEGE